MNQTEIERILKFAKEIRLHTVKALNHLGFGHYGGCLSIVEALAVLYGKVMRIDPNNPNTDNRDYFILSKGHAGPALYSALALKGFFPINMLNTLNQGGGSLPSHPDRKLTVGVDMTTGSLGQGISVACGIAKALQLDQSDNRDEGQWVYCMLGDGELNEGQCWEAIQFAVHNELDSLVLFLDENKKQLDGSTLEICKGLNYEEKFTAFGLNVIRVLGNDVEAIDDAISTAKKVKKKPHMIILDTVKGQGFPYLEQKKDNHHIRPTKEESKIIQEYIKCLEAELGGKGNA